MTTCRGLVQSWRREARQHLLAPVQAASRSLLQAVACERALLRRFVTSAVGGEMITTFGEVVSFDYEMMNTSREMMTTHAFVGAVSGPLAWTTYKALSKQWPTPVCVSDVLDTAGRFMF